MTFYYNPETKQLEGEGYTFISIDPWSVLSESNSVEMRIAGLAIRVAAEVADFFKPGKVQEDDIEGVKDIIKTGKACGAEEIDIEIDREVAQGLNITALEDEAGASILVGQQGKSRCRIKVKYKS